MPRDVRKSIDRTVNGYACMTVDGTVNGDAMFYDVLSGHKIYRFFLIFSKDRILPNFSAVAEHENFAPGL